MKKIILFCSLAMFTAFQVFSQPLIIDHTGTKISDIPESAIQTARQYLHIAYGHTSHGSQLTDGMSGLVAFMNGLGYPIDLYAWNEGGTGGALDLDDYAMAGDVGYYPDWVNNTRAYLGPVDPATGRGTGDHADVNVIIWSWCGQIEEKYVSNALFSEYLDPMTQLETEYFGIKFIYMTGHLDHWDDANNKAANQVVRNYCQENNKILYDFADIESWDPDSNYYQYSNDDCSYYSAGGDYLGNWAIEWQTTHPVNIDWYDCGAAHSQPLNANQKAYAAWWLWACLAGWNPTGTAETGNDSPEISVFPNPSDGKFTLTCSPNKNQPTALEIHNVLGEKVFSSSVDQQARHEIDLSGCSKGIYVIRLHGVSGSHQLKIVLQ